MSRHDLTCVIATDVVRMPVREIEFWKSQFPKTSWEGQVRTDGLQSQLPRPVRVNGLLPEFSFGRGILGMLPMEWLVRGSVRTLP